MIRDGAHLPECPRARGDEEAACDCTRDALRARKLELENALRIVLESAAPHPSHHPTMWAAWRHAETVLENKPKW